MRRLATLAVVAVLMSATVASGQDYSFGDWARDQGYSSGDVMPSEVDAACWPSCSPAIDSLDGIGEFDWTPTYGLSLDHNQISSIESGAFSGLTNLTDLNLYRNQIASIESGAFSGLTNLTELMLRANQISSIESGAFSGLANLKLLALGVNPTLRQPNLEAADFSSLNRFGVYGTVSITSVSLKNAVLNQISLAVLLGGGSGTGIGELNGITEMDLSGIDFANITDLEPLYVMDDLTDLWLVGTKNLDATALDVLLDNLETIEGTDTEGVLYMTQADFDAFDTAGDGLLTAWDAEPGHHVEIVK
jgi:hypothetical protein